MVKIIDFVSKRWSRYKYRFVPWIAFNLRKRKVRSVKDVNSDKIIPDSKVEQSLLALFDGLSCNNGVAASPMLPEGGGCDALDVMFRVAGFAIEQRPSSIAGGGTGVFVTHGNVPAGAVVAMYPGTIYKTWEPILLQSLGNPFIFRCLDGTLIDGNNGRLSRLIYRSCTQRDRVGPYLTSDLSWLTDTLSNPMAVGQYVNNQTNDNTANVAYQEYDVPELFPFQLLRFIPNSFYASSYQQGDSTKTRLMRTVVLVSLRKIQCGEELFSSYFTVVH